MESFVQALEHTLGSNRVRMSGRNPDETERFGHDLWAIRTFLRHQGQLPAQDYAVVRPESVTEVQAILAIAVAHRVPIVPYGAGSGVCGGAVPQSGAVVIDLGGLNQIGELNETDLYVTVESGVRGGDLEAWLLERGYTCGHYPQSIDISSVGGWVATRGSGQFSTLYGNIEDLVVGLEVVTPTGEWLRFPPTAPRRSTGPDLRQLFVGSEGTLCIVTSVSLKVFPVPARRTANAFQFESVTAGFQATHRILRAGLRPAVVRLYDPEETGRSWPQLAASKCSLLLLLFEGEARITDTAMAVATEMAVAEGGCALGAKCVDEWLAHRNDVGAWDVLLKGGVLVDTMEMATTWSNLDALYTNVIAAIRRIPGVLKVSGHASHAYHTGMNVYFTWGAVPKAPDTPEGLYHRVWDAAMEAALEVGATISHHHGVGKLRAEWLRREHPTTWPLLHSVKQLLDPAGICNPGTLFQEDVGQQREGG